MRSMRSMRGPKEGMWRRRQRDRLRRRGSAASPLLLKEPSHRLAGQPLVLPSADVIKFGKHVFLALNGAREGGVGVEGGGGHDGEWGVVWAHDN